MLKQMFLLFYNILDKPSINILYYLIDNINKGKEQGYRTLF